MEIITYILSGALEHRDSMGTGSDHSTRRRATNERRHRCHAQRGQSFSRMRRCICLQIWILPSEQDLTPEYEEKRFTDEEKRNQLRLIVSPDGSEGSVRIHQDAKIYASLLDARSGSGARLKRDAARGCRLLPAPSS